MQVVIIGSGPGGIEAARTVGRAGGKATLVTDGPLWGGKMRGSVLPSKMWAQAADLGRRLKAGALPPDVVAHLEAADRDWQAHLEAELAELGVDLVVGRGAFKSEREVVVKNEEGAVVREIEGDAVIIACGASDFFPPGFEPDGERVFSPGTIHQMGALPEDVIVIGDGGPGFVYMDAFSRLGARVTWLGAGDRVLSFFPESVGLFFEGLFEDRNVVTGFGQPAEGLERDGEGVTVVMPDGKRYRGEAALVSVGLRPDLDALNVSAAGLSVTPRGTVRADEFGRTEVRRVYVVGDATGRGTGNTAMAQGRIAGLDALGLDVAPFRLEQVVVGFDTDPNVAAVGHFRQSQEGLKTTRAPLASVWKAHAQGRTDGYVEIAFDEQRRVVWGVAVGQNAGDLLAPVGLAIRVGATVDDLADVYGMHPTLSEAVFEAARRV